jgi:hypothetical protein
LTSLTSPPIYVGARQLAYATLVNGGRFTQIEQILAFCNIKAPSKTKFYEERTVVCDAIVQLAQARCAEARRAMEAPAIISMDGSWSQRRNAPHCVVDFIDAQTGKIVDFEIIEKPFGFFHGNYTGPSNGMEVEGIHRLIPRWKDDSRVVAFCHDRDAKTAKVIREKWGIDELLDKNHVTKSFDRRIQKTSLMDGLKIKLRKFFKVVLKLDESIDQKQAHWENAVQHYQGNHEHCLPHRADKKHKIIRDPHAIDALRQFLADTKDLIAKVRPGVSTQMCESFHSIKAKLASKDISWTSSWKARVASAILDVNCRGWRLELYYKLGLPRLSDEATAVIERHEAERLRKAERRNTPSQKKKTFYYKSIRRHHVSSLEATGTEYKPLAGTRKAAYTQRGLEEAIDRRIDEASSSDAIEDPDYEDQNVDEEEEEEEEELLETEENPVSDMQLIQASLNAGAFPELDINDEELDQPYVLPPDARFEEHDLTDLSSR